MKKFKLIFAGTILCAAIGVSCLVGLENDVIPSELIKMENVEALTDGEVGRWVWIFLEGEWQLVWLEQRSL